MCDFDALACHSSVWADLVELSESNCNGIFCSDCPAFMQAKWEGKESMVRLLLEHGAEAKRADDE